MFARWLPCFNLESESAHLPKNEGGKRGAKFLSRTDVAMVASLEFVGVEHRITIHLCGIIRGFLIPRLLNPC